MISEKLVKETLQNFIIGGTVIAITSYLAVYLSPTLAAIFWSFPLSLLPVIIYMWIKDQPRKKIGDYAISTAISLVNLGLFVLVFGYLMKHTTDYSVPMSLLIATGVWLVGSLLLYFLYLE